MGSPQLPSDRPPGEPVHPMVFGRLDSGPGTKPESGPAAPSRRAILIGLAGFAVVVLAVVVSRG